MVRRIHAEAMTIHCKVCGFTIKPIGPPSVSDSEKVMETMARHLVSRHKPEALALKQDLAVLTLLLSSYLLLQRYVRIPSEETELLKTFEQAEQTLLGIFAADPKPAS